MMLTNEPKLNIKQIIDLCIKNDLQINDLEQIGFNYETFNREMLIDIIRGLFNELKQVSKEKKELEKQNYELSHEIERYEEIMDNDGIDY